VDAVDQQRCRARPGAESGEDHRPGQVGGPGVVAVERGAGTEERDGTAAGVAVEAVGTCPGRDRQAGRLARVVTEDLTGGGDFALAERVVAHGMRVAILDVRQEAVAQAAARLPI
jgi:hypothetical protein